MPATVVVQLDPEAVKSLAGGSDEVVEPDTTASDVAQMAGRNLGRWHVPDPLLRFVSVRRVLYVTLARFRAVAL